MADQTTCPKCGNRVYLVGASAEGVGGYYAITPSGTPAHFCTPNATWASPLRTEGQTGVAHGKESPVAPDGQFGSPYDGGLASPAHASTSPLPVAPEGARAIAAARPIYEALGFFASVIRSGEPWTTTCDEMAEKAREAVARLTSSGLPAEDAPSQSPAGYVVWDERCKVAHRGHVYGTAEKAEQVLANIVWHSRERHRVRPIYLGEAGNV